MREFPESDWKLFRKKLPGWQESYMERLCEEYVQLLTADSEGSERFWQLEKRIKEDRKKTGVIAEMSRSKMIFNMVDLIREGAITMDDLEDFSEDTRDAVRMIARV